MRAVVLLLAAVGCSSQPITPPCEKQVFTIDGCTCPDASVVPDSGSDATLDAKVEVSVGDGSPCDPGYFYCPGLDSCIATDNCCTTSDCDAAYTCINYGCVPTISLHNPPDGSDACGGCIDGLICQVFCDGQAFCVEEYNVHDGCIEGYICQGCGEGNPSVCCNAGMN